MERARTLAASMQGRLSHPGSAFEPRDEVRTESPAVVTYTAFSDERDGTSRDVTSEVTWSATNVALGTFAGNVFTSTPARGGVTSILARLGTRTAITTLTIRVDTVIVVDPAPRRCAHALRGNRRSIARTRACVSTQWRSRSAQPRRA